MTFDLEKIFSAKQAERRRLAGMPIEEKLRILDALREREVMIRGKDSQSKSSFGGSPPEPTNLR